MREGGRGERERREGEGEGGKDRRGGKTYCLIFPLAPQRPQRPREASLSTLPGM